MYETRIVEKEIYDTYNETNISSFLPFEVSADVRKIDFSFTVVLR